MKTNLCGASKFVRVKGHLELALHPRKLIWVNAHRGFSETKVIEVVPRGTERLNLTALAEEGLTANTFEAAPAVTLELF